MAKRVQAKTGSKRTASPKGTRKAKAKTASSKVKKATCKKKTTKKGVTASSRTTKLASTRSTRSSKAATTTEKTTHKKVAKKKKARTTPKRKTTTREAANRPAKARKATESTPSSPATQSVAQMPPEPRMPKTHLCDNDLAEFKERLLRMRAELSGNVLEMKRHSLDNKAQSGPEYSSMPIHMADLGSDNWEKEFTLGLIANEQTVVREIDEALERIRDRTYGVCLVTHKRISKARLRAKPWAKYCIQYALAREEGRAI